MLFFRMTHVQKISSTDQSIEQYLRPYKNQFRAGLGTMRVPKVHLETKPR